jgi:hypothetical protein
MRGGRLKQQVISHEHPVDGYLKIYREDDHITIDFHWPFDSETDDWIDIQNEFRLADYASAVAEARIGYRGRAEGTNSATGWAGRSLRLSVPEPIEKFMATT